MRRALLLLGLVAVLAGGAVLLLELRRNSSDDVAAEQSAAATGAANEASAVERARARVPADVKTPADVDRLLGEIEARAKRTGSVTDADIERGHAAILALAPALGRHATLAKGRRFDEAMRRLQRAAQMKPTHDELQRIEKALAENADKRQRERLVAEYRIAAQQLPAAYRAEAMAKLADHSASASDPTSRRP